MKRVMGILLIFIAMMTQTGFSQTLFDEKKYSALVEDHRSHQVGESLTILIYEQASAATSAGTDTNKSMDLSAGAGKKSRSEIGNLEFNNKFKGGGTVSRTGKLIASVTVTIREILDSAEMLIEGKQLIEFNNEKQFIHVSGRVRPEDISTENTVVSTRVADAKITYMGDGLLGKRQKPGFLTRVVNWVF